MRLVSNTEDFAESTDSQSFIIISFQGSHVSKGGGCPMFVPDFIAGGVCKFREAVHGSSSQGRDADLYFYELHHLTFEVTG